MRQRVSNRWLSACVVAAVLVACRQGVPVVDTTPGPARSDGTISGTVRGPEGTSAVNGRLIEVVNLDTGQRQRTVTNTSGGFTFKVPPGRYRVELPLRKGEVLVKRPGTLDVNRSDVDAHADFVLGSWRLSRPPAPHLRGEDGLGAPIA